MNTKQRKQWEELVIDAVNSTKSFTGLTLDTFDQQNIVIANAYILKLERELQNIKAGKRIAAILKPHGGPR
jgi:hypothetical protein